VLLQIETREALNHALEIAEVDGVDGLFFGPADIAADIGQLGKPMCNEVWDLVMPVAKKLIASGMPVGTLVQDPQFAAKLFNEGFSFVACGSDTDCRKVHFIIQFYYSVVLTFSIPLKGISQLSGISVKFQIRRLGSFGAV